MKVPHSPYHWITVALVTAAALLTLDHAWGQSTGSAAAFEGRPAMGGAQGGLGAQAGPPQGGLGSQGMQGMQIGPTNRVTPDVPPPPTLPGASQVPAAVDGPKPTPDRDMKPKDNGMAPSNRSASSTAKKAGKRTMERARHGVSPIDMASVAP